MRGREPFQPTANPPRRRQAVVDPASRTAVVVPRRRRGWTMARLVASESVRKDYVRLQRFRSMTRMDARRKKASALRFKLSQSFANLRQRLVGSETGAPV